MIFGALIIFFLIVEPHGLARLWADRQGEAAAVAVPVLRRAGELRARTLGVGRGQTRSRRITSTDRPARTRPANGGVCEMSAKRLRLAARGGGRGTALPRRRCAQNEQFIPALVYRTGAYAPNGIPFANGIADYYKLVNERDGGINGVKIMFEECETGYATDRGVECYERSRAKGPTGAAS